jgi:hypothetical protein
MFSKAGIIELHAAMHERLDLLLRHVATVPDDLHHSKLLLRETLHITSGRFSYSIANREKLCSESIPVAGSGKG